MVELIHRSTVSPRPRPSFCGESCLKLFINTYSGGVKWPELTPEQGLNVDFFHLIPAFTFQEDLLKTLMQIEETYFNLAAGHGDKNVLVICDRGSMDPSACESFPSLRARPPFHSTLILIVLGPDEWQRMQDANGWNMVELRDKRYNHIIHMV